MAQDANSGNSVQAQSGSENNQPSEHDQQMRQARIKVMWVGGFLFCLVAIVAIMTFMRSLRRFHKQTKLGEKAPPTEYFDAWKNYRLKDENKE